MTLRDTRIGRWARKHDRTHRLIHATWCRAVGPFDTKRVASSNGSVTGGGSTTPAYSSFVVFYSTGGGVQYKTTTQSDAEAWAKANAPVGSTWTVFGINGGQHLLSSGTGSNTTPPTGSDKITLSAPSTIPNGTIVSLGNGVLGTINTNNGISTITPIANNVYTVTEKATGNLIWTNFAPQGSSSDAALAAFASSYNPALYTLKVTTS